MTQIEQNAGSAPVWSLTVELREIESADCGMIPELVSLFLDDSAGRLQTLNSAGIRRDFKTVRAQAHSLKGSAQQMGAIGLASLCSALELSDSAASDECECAMRTIGDEFVLVRRAMEEYLVKIQQG
jgi:HPt (histidine-containing phosphotransfer) domain-containing protein